MKRVKDSEILKEAARYIRDGKTHYICYAIEDVEIGTSEQKNALTHWVMHMLKGATFYEMWLITHHPKIYWKHRSDPSWLRKARLAWLEWMITYCKQEEENVQH